MSKYTPRWELATTPTPDTEHTPQHEQQQPLATAAPAQRQPMTKVDQNRMPDRSSRWDPELLPLRGQALQTALAKKREARMQAMAQELESKKRDDEPASGAPPNSRGSSYGAGSSAPQSEPASPFERARAQRFDQMEQELARARVAEREREQRMQQQQQELEKKRTWLNPGNVLSHNQMKMTPPPPSPTESATPTTTRPPASGGFGGFGGGRRARETASSAPSLDMLPASERLMRQKREMEQMRHKMNQGLELGRGRTLNRDMPATWDASLGRTSTQYQNAEETWQGGFEGLRDLLSSPIVRSVLVVVGVGFLIIMVLLVVQNV